MEANHLRNEIKNEQDNDSEEKKLLKPRNQKLNEWQPCQKQPAKLRSYQANLSDQFEIDHQYNIHENIKDKRKEGLFILTLLALMTLVLLLVAGYDSHLQIEIMRYTKIAALSDGSFGGEIAGLSYRICPKQNSAFHVYYNETDTQMQHIPKEVAKRIALCQVHILNSAHLAPLVEKWNLRFISNQIKLEQIVNWQERKTLLILLQQYFSSGTYLDLQIPYDRISQRCWKHSLTGFDTMFVDFTEKNQKGIYVPDTEKFMKVRFPYSPQIKNMIDKLIKKEDFLTECKQRQCLIIKCLQ